MADADAEIVRGLIAILERLYSGQKAAEVAAFDIEGFFGRIGLEQFITSQRRNGLAGMVAKIRELAGEIVDVTRRHEEHEETINGPRIFTDFTVLVVALGELG